MGWTSGSEVASEVWDLVRAFIPENNRKEVGNKLIDIFENQDCDTMQECELLMKDTGRY